MAFAHIENFGNVKCERHDKRSQSTNQTRNNFFVNHINNCPARESNRQDFSAAVGATANSAVSKLLFALLIIMQDYFLKSLNNTQIEV